MCRCSVVFGKLILVIITAVIAVTTFLTAVVLTRLEFSTSL